MTNNPTEQPNTSRDAFDKWAASTSPYTHPTEVTTLGLMRHAWQAAQADLLAKLDSPELGLLIEEALVDAPGIEALFWERIAAKAALAAVRTYIEQGGEAMNLDRTFCASPGCKGECGREWTKEHEKAAERAGKKYISMAYFCGEPEMKQKEIIW